LRAGVLPVRVVRRLLAGLTNGRELVTRT